MTVEASVTEVEANPTSSTPSLRLTRTMHTLRATAERSTVATLLTTIEPTSALHPTPPTAGYLPVPHGHAITFADETVLIYDDELTDGNWTPNDITALLHLANAEQTRMVDMQGRVGSRPASGGSECGAVRCVIETPDGRITI